jgi:hypothetical protein
MASAQTFPASISAAVPADVEADAQTWLQQLAMQLQPVPMARDQRTPSPSTRSNSYRQRSSSTTGRSPILPAAGLS